MLMVTRVDGPNATEGVNTIDLPCELQRPGTLGWRRGRGVFPPIGAEKLMVIGEAPSTSVLDVAGTTSVTCIGRTAAAAPWPPALCVTA